MAENGETARQQNEGYRCLGCGRVFKSVPTEEYEDGHGGRQLDMCPCGCDLFEKVQSEEGRVMAERHNCERCGFKCDCDYGTLAGVAECQLCQVCEVDVEEEYAGISRRECEDG